MVIDVYSIQGVRGASIPVEVVADLKPIDLGRSVVECTAPVVFKGAVTNAGDCMVVDGRIVSKAKATCDVCLSDFEMCIDIPFTQSYCKNDNRASKVVFDEEDNLEDDEDEVVVYSGDEIDIFPDVEQAVVLSLPITIKCKEGCLGLCPECGANLNKGKCPCSSSN